MATLNQFRDNFKGVRSNRFKVNGSFPTGEFDAQDFEFYCKASSVPGSSIGVIPVGYKGRPVKFSGERSYQDWLIQIYDSSTKDLSSYLILKLNQKKETNIIFYYEFKYP
jgi:hypothetical protein